MSTEMRRPEVAAIYREVTEVLKDTDFAFLMNFGGLTVAQLTELRTALGSKGAKATVIKNSYIAKVAADLGWDDLSEILSGPTAVITGNGDVADIAKTLVEFVKKNEEKAAIKGGQLNKKAVTEIEIKALSELISLAAQQARLLGTLQAPASQMARVLQAKNDAAGEEAAPAAEEAAPAAEEAPVAEEAAPAATPEA